MTGNYHQIGIYTIMPIADDAKFKEGLGRVIEYYLRDRGVNAQAVINVENMEDLKTVLKVDNTIYILLSYNSTLDARCLERRFRSIIENSGYNGIEVRISKTFDKTFSSKNKVHSLNVIPKAHLSDKDITAIIKYITSTNPILHINTLYSIHSTTINGAK